MKKKKTMFLFYGQTFLPKEKKRFFWQGYFDIQQQKGISYIKEKEASFLKLQKEKRKIYFDEKKDIFEKEKRTVFYQKDLLLKEKENFEKQEKTVFREKEKIQKDRKKWKEIFKTEKEKEIQYQTNLIQKENITVQNAIRQKKFFFWENENTTENKKDTIYKYYKKLFFTTKNNPTFLVWKSILSNQPKEKYYLLNENIIYPKSIIKKELKEKNIFFQKESVLEKNNNEINIWQRELKKQYKGEKIKQNDIKNTPEKRDVPTREKENIFLKETKIDIDVLLQDITQRVLEERERSSKIYQQKI